MPIIILLLPISMLTLFLLDKEKITKNLCVDNIKKLITKGVLIRTNELQAGR